jgi:branched-chain amino acid transport system permease protein
MMPSLPIVEIAIYGAVLGGVYALMATGFNLVYGVARVLNFAYGSFYMIAAYLILALVDFRIAFLPSFVISLASVFLMGMALFLLLRRTKSAIGVVVITFAVAYLLQYLIEFAYTNEYYSIPGFVSGSSLVLGVSVENQRLVSFFLSIGSTLILYGFINRSKLGKAIRATAQNTRAAILMGVDVDRVYFMVMGISSVLAGLAGALISPYQALFPSMWSTPLFTSFTVSILGGLGSFEGSIVAALILAYAQIAVIFLIGPVYSDLIAFVVLVLVIFARPTGILGRGVEAHII